MTKYGIIQETADAMTLSDCYTDEKQIRQLHIDINLTQY